MSSKPPLMSNTKVSRPKSGVPPRPVPILKKTNHMEPASMTENTQSVYSFNDCEIKSNQIKQLTHAI